MWLFVSARILRLWWSFHAWSFASVKIHRINMCLMWTWTEVQTSSLVYARVACKPSSPMWRAYVCQWKFGQLCKYIMSDHELVYFTAYVTSNFGWKWVWSVLFLHAHAKLLLRHARAHAWSCIFLFWHVGHSIFAAQNMYDVYFVHACLHTHTLTKFCNFACIRKYPRIVYSAYDTTCTCCFMRQKHLTWKKTKTTSVGTSRIASGTQSGRPWVRFKQPARRGWTSALGETHLHGRPSEVGTREGIPTKLGQVCLRVVFICAYSDGSQWWGEGECGTRVD